MATEKLPFLLFAAVSCYICNSTNKTHSDMGLISNLLGNATEVDLRKINEEFMPILYPGEELEAAYRIFRKKWIFTSTRLIIEDIQGMTGKKREYHSIPYKAITHFLIETAGNFDTDCEMKIWISGTSEPFCQEFSKGIDIKGIQQRLAHHVLTGK